MYFTLYYLFYIFLRSFDFMITSHLKYRLLPSHFMRILNQVCLALCNDIFLRKVCGKFKTELHRTSQSSEQHSCFIFGSPWVQFSVRRSAILTAVSGYVHQSIRILEQYLKLAHDHILCIIFNSLYITHHHSTLFNLQH